VAGFDDRGSGLTVPWHVHLAVAANILALLTVGVWTIQQGDAADSARGTPSPQPPTSSSEAEEVAAPTSLTSSAVATERSPEPQRITVPSGGVDSELVPLGKEPDGSLEVPSDPTTAGWWTGGARPGEQGPAVIVGHVDSYEGPGVFFDIGDLAEGETTTIQREDGTSVLYRVDRVERHPKDRFPTEAVYGHTDAATLRLITCSGTFDRQERSYENNTIVFLNQVRDDRSDDGRSVTAPQPEPSTEPPNGENGPEPTLPSEKPWDHRVVPIAAGLLSVLGTGASVIRQLTLKL
jgi:sortase (surface protein transpeptidase)